MMKPFDLALPKPKFDDSGKRIKPCPRRTVGQSERRIISRKVVNGKEYAYHATKGWRVRRP